MKPEWVVGIVRLTAKLLAFAGAIAIPTVTLVPMRLRPIIAGMQTEHLIAFATLGVLFGIAYPSRPTTMLVVIVIAAAVLEIAQQVASGRHSSFTDFWVKAFGAGIGIGAATAVNAGLRRWFVLRAENSQR